MTGLGKAGFENKSYTISRSWANKNSPLKGAVFAMGFIKCKYPVYMAKHTFTHKDMDNQGTLFTYYQN